MIVAQLKPKVILAQMNYRRGLRRLGILIALLWFGYWGLRFWDALNHYQFVEQTNFALDSLDARLELSSARDRMIGTLLAAFFYPALVAFVICVTRWVWRGFQPEESGNSEAISSGNRSSLTDIEDALKIERSGT